MANTARIRDFGVTVGTLPAGPRNAITDVPGVRAGSFLGHGSGDIVVGFTTANRVDHDEKRDVVKLAMLNEPRIDLAFRATAESVEEAVLNAMVAAPATEGRGGRRESLYDILDALGYRDKAR